MAQAHGAAGADERFLGIVWQGRALFVVPELDLVALIQAGNYGDGRTRNEFRDRYMRQSILAAALALIGE